MADKQNAPRFDAAAIRAKRRKSKGVKMLDKDTTSSRGLKDPIREVPSPSHSSKHQRIGDGLAIEDIEPGNPRPNSPGILEVAFPLIGSSVHLPPPPGLVFFVDPNRLLKDTARFIMEFDGYAGTPVNSIYDRCFLNEVFIDPS